MNGSNHLIFVTGHPSGLTILLYPMEGFSTAYGLFGTNYGSVDTCFRRAGEKEFTTVPAGIAHYLEHKLFESEDGDAFRTVCGGPVPTRMLTLRLTGPVTCFPAPLILISRSKRC